MDKLVDLVMGIYSSLKYGKSNLVIQKEKTLVEMPAACRSSTILILKVLINISADLCFFELSCKW